LLSFCVQEFWFWMLLIMNVELNLKLISWIFVFSGSLYFNHTLLNSNVPVHILNGKPLKCCFLQPNSLVATKLDFKFLTCIFYSCNIEGYMWHLFITVLLAAPCLLCLLCNYYDNYNGKF
jgi:hypothetical protein